MRNALRTAWYVLGWVVLLTLWNTAALMPIFAKVRPLYVTAWIVLLTTGLGIKYFLPPGETLRQRLTALRAPLPAQSKWILPLGIATTLLNASFASVGGAGDTAGEALITDYAALPMGFLPLLLFMLVFAPVFEELAMRRKVLGLLRAPLGAHGAVLVSGALFGLMHFGQSGGVLGRFCAGVVAGEAVLVTGSLSSAIVLHAINNGLGVLFALLAELAPPSVIERAQEPSSAGVLVMGLVGSVGVIEFMRRLRAGPAPTAIESVI